MTKLLSHYKMNITNKTPYNGGIFMIHSAYKANTKTALAFILSLLFSTNQLTVTLPTIKIEGQEATEHYLAGIYAENAELTNDPITFADHFVQTLKQQEIDHFWLGASSSAYQFEGGNDETSSAAQHFRNLGFETAGKAINFWNQYATDIPQMKNELGIDCHRMSLSWNRIEPQEGVFNYEELAHYADILKTYAAHGITPLVNLHHYDEPLWFKEKGGFVADENRDYFVRFVTTAYDYLHNDMSFLTICNSVEGAAFKAYYTGDLFPGEKGNLQKTQECMANMDIAILESALAIRQLHDSYVQSGNNVTRPFIITQINIALLDPANETKWDAICYPFSKLCCKWGMDAQTKGTFSLFTTGTYTVYIPMKANLSKEYANAPELFAYAFDAIGINHYSNMFMRGVKKLVETDPTRCTESKNYRDYPEGLYRAITYVHDNFALPVGRIKYGAEQALPIIITENGIATKNDDNGNKKRELFFKKSLLTILQAIKDGYNVIGYLPWASHDNYEWPSHESKGQSVFGHRCYGFFHVDIDPKSPTYLQRTLKSGSRHFATFAKHFTKYIKENA